MDCAQLSGLGYPVECAMRNVTQMHKLLYRNQSTGCWQPSRVARRWRSIGMPTAGCTVKQTSQGSKRRERNRTYPRTKKPSFQKDGFFGLSSYSEPIESARTT